MTEAALGGPAAPVVRRIGFHDLKYALRMGLRDFLQCPLYGLVIAALFVAGGMAIAAALRAGGAFWLILPVAVAFPLLGPFVVVGLYEVSHRLEGGQRPGWSQIARRILGQIDGQIPSIAFVMIFFAGIWFFLAHLVFALFLGLSAMTNISTSLDVLLSMRGLAMLGVGTAVGAALAFVLFSLTVVSIPLLVDREIDFVTGMITSVQVVIRNFPIMALWALMVGFLTLLAMIPLFLGLLVVLPVLGHATWHLYRRVLEPA